MSHDGLQEADELGDRLAAELREPAGIERRQGLREHVLGVGGGQTKGSQGPAADLLEGRKNGTPGIAVAIDTALDQVEEILADRVLRGAESSTPPARNPPAPASIHMRDG